MNKMFRLAAEEESELTAIGFVWSPVYHNYVNKHGVHACQIIDECSTTWTLQGYNDNGYLDTNDFPSIEAIVENYYQD